MEIIIPPGKLKKFLIVTNIIYIGAQYFAKVAFIGNSSNEIPIQRNIDFTFVIVFAVKWQ